MYRLRTQTLFYLSKSSQRIPLHILIGQVTLPSFSFSLLFHHVRVSKMMHVFHYQFLIYRILLRETLTLLSFSSEISPAGWQINVCLFLLK